MSGFSQTPKFILRLIHLPPRFVYAVGLGQLMGKLVLLLTTTGRKSGKPRVTPLQYEEIDGAFYVGAARGLKADWVRNLQANPVAQIRVKNRNFNGQAEIVTEPARIADFLAYRYQRHPRMLAAMLRGDGLSIPPIRKELEAYAKELALVIIHPD
ncbi:MAG: nitroreductase family deazaflavin-dependent oxidoreductase [Anaerolineaceae bacterium]|nr:nitroreductase family deazaflavin-dependent oxidoreductase [Anaerolineaceae bacterium]